MTVPFAFVPVPRAVQQALRDEHLTRDQYVVLTALYARASYRTWTTRCTLAQLAEEVPWGHSLNYLRKILSRLQADGWIAYSTTPGKKRARYEFSLLHDREKVSEDRPRTEARTSPRTNGAQSGSTPAVAAPASSDQSEDGEQHRDASRPRRSASGPRIEQGASAVAERDSADADGAAVRAPSDVQSKTNLCTKESVDPSASTADVREGSDAGDGPPAEDETDNDRFLALVTANLKPRCDLCGEPGGTDVLLHGARAVACMRCRQRRRLQQYVEEAS